MVLTGQNVIGRQRSSQLANNIARKPFYEEYFGGIQSEDRTKYIFLV